MNKSDNDGNSPAHYSCKAPNADVEILSSLLKFGASATKRNKHSQTPLNWVSFFQNDPYFIEVLLAYPGVDLNDCDNKGTTLAANAAFSCNGKVLSYLLENGADPNAAADDGTTPLID